MLNQNFFDGGLIYRPVKNTSNRKKTYEANLYSKFVYTEDKKT